MNLFKYKNALLKILILNQFLIIGAIKPHILFAENFNKPSNEYIKNIPKNNFYILGPGDVLNLKVSEDSLAFNQSFSIDGEGTSYLKRLKKVYLEGLTIGELTEILNKEYSKFVIDPQVEIEILRYRPI